MLVDHLVTMEIVAHIADIKEEQNGLIIEGIVNNVPCQMMINMGVNATIIWADILHNLSPE